MLRGDRADHRSDRVLGTHVEVDGLGVLDAGGNRACRVEVDIGDEHRGAAGLKETRDRCPDPAPSAGDQRKAGRSRILRRSCHGMSLSRVWLSP